MGMDIAIDLSQNAAGCINVGPACQDQHQPDSPEFTLHHSISKKFTIQNLFVLWKKFVGPAFDGYQLIWELKTPEHGRNRAELLYQLFNMAGN